ncbi:hypothetical protein FOZ63_020217, partial [Perkinsus olseni]
NEYVHNRQRGRRDCEKYNDFIKQSKIGCNDSVSFEKGDMYEFMYYPNSGKGTLEIPVGEALGWFIPDLCTITIAMKSCEAQAPSLRGVTRLFDIVQYCVSILATRMIMTPRDEEGALGGILAVALPFKPNKLLVPNFKMPIA